MLEAVDQVAQEREPNPALYRMLTGALRTLATSASPAVTPAFFWKLLSLEGFHPLLEVCVRCGEEEADLVAFAVDDGGMCCAQCAMGGGRPVSPAALDVLRRMLGGGLNGVLATAGDAPVAEVERLGVTALEHHIERRLRSASLL
jgi:DNA repair protein RecO (recombination protein O)